MSLGFNEMASRLYNENVSKLFMTSSCNHLNWTDKIKALMLADVNTELALAEQHLMNEVLDYWALGMPLGSPNITALPTPILLLLEAPSQPPTYPSGS